MRTCTPTRRPAACTFSAETLVVTVDGLEPIAEIEATDLVLAYDEATGDIGFFPVLAVWAHTDPLIVELTIDGETIETTLEHPFYTADGTWIAAGDLQPGDELRNAAWHTGTVEQVFVTYRPQPMYNFTVAEAHTYFVGDARWLVHNACQSARLAQNMIQNGATRPAESAAHHIVAFSDQRAAPARSILARFGIDLNDSANGVFLPANTNSVNPNGAAIHSTLHTDAYYRAINRVFAGASNRSDLLSILNGIQQQLLNNTFPR